MLVALQRTTRTRALVARARVFGVAILAAGQQAIADRFAGRDEAGEDHFAGISNSSFCFRGSSHFWRDGVDGLQGQRDA